MTQDINLNLSEELIEKVDVAAEILNTSRTEIVETALQQYLQKREGDEEFKERAVELYLHDEIGFEFLKQIIGQQDAESAREAKPLLERGEDLGDGLADIRSD